MRKKTASTDPTPPCAPDKCLLCTLPTPSKRAALARAEIEEAYLEGFAEGVQSVVACRTRQLCSKHTQRRRKAISARGIRFVRKDEVALH